MIALHDDQVLPRARAGDPDAFAVLFRDHQAFAVRIARSIRVRDADVDDVVADAFTNTFEAIRRGRGPTDSFRPYLARAVRTTYYGRLRRRSSNAEVLHDDVPPSMAPPAADESFEPTIDNGRVARAFATLPSRWQQVIRATEIEGRRLNDVGAELGMSANAVAALAFRARAGFRRAYLDTWRRDDDAEHIWALSVAELYRWHELALDEVLRYRSHVERCADCQECDRACAAFLAEPLAAVVRDGNGDATVPSRTTTVPSRPGPSSAVADRTGPRDVSFVGGARSSDGSRQSLGTEPRSGVPATTVRPGGTAGDASPSTSIGPVSTRQPAPSQPAGVAGVPTTIAGLADPASTTPSPGTQSTVAPGTTTAPTHPATTTVAPTTSPSTHPPTTVPSSTDPGTGAGTGTGTGTGAGGHPSTSTDPPR